MHKYYLQRHILWSLYDHGISMDEEGWYSVTPESIARHIAKRCNRRLVVEETKKRQQQQDNAAMTVVLDAFCGCGGNSVQFAMVFDHVLSVDIDPEKIRHARHNASIYGVQDKIHFVQADFTQLCTPIGRRLLDEWARKTWGREHNDSGVERDVDDIEIEWMVFLGPPWSGPQYSQCAMYDIETMMPEPLNGRTLFEQCWRNIR